LGPGSSNDDTSSQADLVKIVARHMSPLRDGAVVQQPSLIQGRNSLNLLLFRAYLIKLTSANAGLKRPEARIVQA